VLLLDASVWAAVFDPEDRFHAPARSIVLDPARPVSALDLTLYEIANVLGVKMGLPEKAREVGRLIVDRCQDRFPRVDPSSLQAACLLADEYKLTAYDAAYVATARRNGWQLVSLDLRNLVSKGLAVAPDEALYS
jgi:predicted nucleic acid-binding protein